ncbi:MAG: thioredoxin [Planctomycetota bacterium]|nr:thioredoxin [Planctomycetota bacterium]
MGAATVAVTDSTWEAEIENFQGYALADFWAEWCGPCKMIAPTLDELAGEYGAKLKIAKLDVDSNGEVAGKFGIRSIPCLILFKNGQEVDRLVGAHNKAALKQWIDQKTAG